MNINDLIEANMGIARDATNKLHKKMPFLNKEDIYSCALEGLWQACKSYDEGKGIALSTYAYKCIKNNVLKTLLRGKNRELKRKILTMKEIEEESSFTTSKTVLEDELIERDIIEKAKRYVSNLGDKRHIIFDLHFLFGYTGTDIAVLFENSPSNINSIIKKIKKDLKSHLQNETDML